MQTQYKNFACAALVALLTACGGGGGGDAPTAEPSPAPVNAVSFQLGTPIPDGSDNAGNALPEPLRIASDQRPVIRIP